MNFEIEANGNGYESSLEKTVAYEILNALIKIDLNQLTPTEVMCKLSELKERLKKEDRIKETKVGIPNLLPIFGYGTLTHYLLETLICQEWISTKELKIVPIIVSQSDILRTRKLNSETKNFIDLGSSLKPELKIPWKLERFVTRFYKAGMFGIPLLFQKPYRNTVIREILVWDKIKLAIISAVNTQSISEIFQKISSMREISEMHHFEILISPRGFDDEKLAESALFTNNTDCNLWHSNFISSNYAETAKELSELVHVYIPQTGQKEKISRRKFACYMCIDDVPGSLECILLKLLHPNLQIIDESKKKDLYPIIHYLRVQFCGNRYFCGDDRSGFVDGFLSFMPLKEPINYRYTLSTEKDRKEISSIFKERLERQLEPQFSEEAEEKSMKTNLNSEKRPSLQENWSKRNLECKEQPHCIINFSKPSFKGTVEKILKDSSRDDSKEIVAHIMACVNGDPGAFLTFLLALNQKSIKEDEKHTKDIMNIEYLTSANCAFPGKTVNLQIIGTLESVEKGVIKDLKEALNAVYIFTHKDNSEYIEENLIKDLYELLKKNENETGEAANNYNENLAFELHFLMYPEKLSDKYHVYAAYKKQNQSMNKTETREQYDCISKYEKILNSNKEEKTKRSHDKRTICKLTRIINALIEKLEKIKRRKEIHDGEFIKL